MPDLNLAKGCCRQAGGLKGSIMPFNRCLVLEYGFGTHTGADSVPVSGLVQCGKCKRCFRFVYADRKDQAVTWRFAAADPSAMDRLVTAYSRVKTPKWPVWVPPGEIRNDQVRAIREVEDFVWGSGGEYTMILSAKHIVSGRVLESTAVTPD